MPNQIFAYARVSTSDQNLDLQIDALKKNGYDKLFKEKLSGKKTTDRPELTKMLEQLREGDTVVIYKLDRISRSTKDLIAIAEDLKERKVNFISLKEKIDTKTAMGMCFFNVTSAFAQLERDMISERTKAGLEAARKRGKKPGRKKGMSEALKLKCKSVYAIYQSDDSQSVESLCKKFEIPKSSFYRYKNQFIDNAPEKQMDAFAIR
jgi:DNA invertase Pin-like site-specific DNA recombinase